MLWWTLYNAQSAMLDDTCYGVMTFTMMCTSYMHITCWWWWWVFDDDVSTYPMTWKYNLWWYSALVKQKYFSNCEWQWTVCTSRFRDWYVTDLTGSQVRHISSENRFWCLTGSQVRHISSEYRFWYLTGSQVRHINSENRFWYLTGSQVRHISSEYWFLYLTGPQVRQYSTYQGGRTGQGKEVVASFR